MMDQLGQVILLKYTKNYLAGTGTQTAALAFGSGPPAYRRDRRI
jgi:hypothetical protein